MMIEIYLMLMRCTVCSSKYNRGGVKRDTDEDHRVHEILETGQNGRRHLGYHLHCRGSFRRRVRIIGRRTSLHRKVTCPRDATLHV